MKKLCLVFFILGFFGIFQTYLPGQDANLTRVGEWGTGFYKDVCLKGNYAFCAASFAGLDIVDISDRSRPIKVGNCDISGFAWRLDVSGSYAYIASWDALAVVDVSDPASPVEVCRCDVGGYVYDVQVKENYVYLAGSLQGTHGLHVMDVSYPSSPFLVGQYGIPPYVDVSGLFIRGNYAYLAVDFGLEIIDITVPSAPVPVGRVDTSGYMTDVYASGNYVYTASFLPDGGYEPAYLDIIDVSNLAAPVIIGTYTTYGIPGEVVVSGNHAYFAGGKSGLHIIDVSTPSTPSPVKNYKTPGSPEGLVVDGQHVLAADNYGGLRILDVSTPTDPTPVGAFDYSADIKDVTVKGNYAYAAGGREGLLIFNVSNPSSPRLVSTYDVGGSLEEIYISGTLAYVVPQKDLYDPDPYDTLYILDLSNPLAPSPVGSYQASSYIDDVYIKGNYAYVLIDSRTLAILDIADPSQITLMGTYTTSDFTSRIRVSGNYAYITQPWSGVEVIDVSDPANPTHAGINDSIDSPWDISGNGNYAYVTGSSFAVLDISGPSSPSLVGTYDYGSFGSVYRLHSQGNYVYLPNLNGIRVLDVSDPASPTLTADYDAVESDGVYVSGNYVYLAGAGYGKLLVLLLEGDKTPPQIQVNPGQLQFVADTSGSVGDSRTIYVNKSGEGTLDWDVSDSENWIIFTPRSGTNRGVVEVTVDAHGLAPGTYTGAVFFSSPNAANSPIAVNVTLTVYESGQTSAPFGSFDTPAHGAVVYSSVPFTGWALDDVGMEKVELFREDMGSLVYIGDAVFVEGARPDVERAYPGYPNNNKAGWGYMMLTNYLPNQGNGTFTIHAAATDVEGHRVTLGSKTVIADNANAVKPFGAIDTPPQGGVVSGNNYVNFGWVLTPLPNTIPADGSTLWVWVDGVPLGHPVYNQYRQDIAELFPDYNNSNGAVGYFYLDTTPYDNGVHTIQWTAADDAGNTDGIGSRYFTIQNSDFPQQAENRGLRLSAWNPPDLLNSPKDFGPVIFRKGCDKDPQPELIYPDDDGVITVEIKELGRLELRLEMNITAAYQVVEQRYGPLPWGSFLDRETGIFYWQPGPGYVGRYRLIFIAADDSGKQTRKDVEVIIRSKY
jgi:hypothetical protein